MDGKQAIREAKSWLLDTLNDENISNVGLEEIEFDDRQNAWRITLGFSRPWNTVRNALTAMTGEPATRRAYRVLILDNITGKVKSMKKTSDEN